eukprot:CAMPEP_0197307028 /NCGR_PEP_ID=MMETSP0891-20130614/4464_1 /TAXON_ID=44058 ORGANISM="Aureoumbra lagunensis, Strain CCMP1510" /NCGR_SAMPLE_ID=MMETSP0891 /ASSEMBLY_ACC=CAM_ASM_000534 /LENGTH=810 /DNA_ID=CAMNT_0042790001 /DNA_START=228 /DNA_END=2657 /DNA_ORIENTATION=+
MEFPEQSEDYDGEEVSCMMNQFGSEVCLMNSGIEQSVEVIPEKKDDASINFVTRLGGLGLGQGEERFLVLNARVRDDTGIVRYGDIIALRCRMARDRCLGLDTESGELRLGRSLIGNAERWELVPVKGNYRRGDCLRSGDAVGFKPAVLLSGYYLGVSDDAPCMVRNASSWILIQAGSPRWPSWLEERKYLSGNFLLDTERGDDDTHREDLVDDVLSALAGTEGGLVRAALNTTTTLSKPDSSRLVFRIESDESNKDLADFDLARRCVSTGEAYCRLRSFAASRLRYERGRVAHALAAEIRRYLREYLVFIAQLESKKRQNKLRLQELVYWLQRPASSLKALDKCRRSIASPALKGGALLLALLSFREEAADDEELKIANELTKAAAEPYLNMLNTWLSSGILDDPYGEFLVVDSQANKHFTNYWWETNFTQRPELAVGPTLKSRCWQICIIGKYARVLTTSGHDEFSFSITFDEMANETDDGPLSARLDIAHRNVSTALFRLVMQENKSAELVMELKKYFLCGQGDVFANFMELADNELNSRKVQVSTNRLDSLLQLALAISGRPSSAPRLKIHLTQRNLLDHLRAVHGHAIDEDEDSMLLCADAIELDLQVKWPASILVPSKCLIKYQLIFRHVFRIKRLERSLLQVWSNHMATNILLENKSSGLRAKLAKPFHLRHRMLHFIQNYAYYLMFEVIETRHTHLRDTIDASSTLDDATANHDRFLDLVLRDCLLTNHSLFALLAQLTDICERFTIAARRFADAAFLDTDDTHTRRISRSERLKLRRSHLERAVKAASHYFESVDEQTIDW